jgi:Ornithine cyclodeaminase/mu-crystallin family
MILTLSEADVAKVLNYEQLIPEMEKALSVFSAGRVIQPVRNMLTIEEGMRFLGIMPAVAEDAMGAKLVCFFPKNAGSKLPTHMAMIMLFQPDTGEPLALLDGRLITEMRTAAVSAAVTKYLAPNTVGKRSSGTGTSAGASPCMPVRRSEGMEPDSGPRAALCGTTWCQGHGSRDCGAGRGRGRDGDKCFGAILEGGLAEAGCPHQRCRLSPPKMART